MDDINPVERAALVRTRHIIRPIANGTVIVCERDGVRVHPIKTGWRHDTPEMVRVNAEAAAIIKPTQDGVRGLL